MAFSQNELASQLKHLKRAPAPKLPVAAAPTSPVGGVGTIDFSAIKLKKTGKRESLIEGDMDQGKENSSNELNNIFATRKKMFEQGTDHSQKPATMPRVAPKPWRISEGETFSKPRSGSEPESMKGRNESEVTEGKGTPTLRPLPTLQSLGLKPPTKPPKPLILTMKVEKKYKNYKVMIAPKVKAAIIEEVKNGTFDQGAPHIPSKPPPPAPVEPELIEEDTYDDVDQLAEIVKSQLEQSNRPSLPSKPPPPQPELIEEDTYDDVDQIAEIVKSQLGQQQADQSLNIENSDDQFGEDFYQPVEGGFSFEKTVIEPADMDDEEKTPEQPNQSQSSKESKEEFKARKERERKEKELQKKKEREKERRKKEEERREKEEKKKKEDERKRREKMDRDLKKTHKLKGNEPTIERGTTKEEVVGSGKDLPCAKGSSLEVITKDNCPSGKWLVKDQQGHYGYVSSENLLLQGNQADDISMDDNLDEDLYECVDTIRSQSSPQPPVTSSVPVTNDVAEDLYDDTVVEDEDFYDDIPGAS